MAGPGACSMKVRPVLLSINRHDRVGWVPSQEVGLGRQSPATYNSFAPVLPPEPRCSARGRADPPGGGPSGRDRRAACTRGVSAVRCPLWEATRAWEAPPTVRQRHTPMRENVSAVS